MSGGWGLAGRILRGLAVLTAVAALGLQLLIEMVVKGLGGGLAPASGSLFIWSVVVPIPLIFSGLAFLSHGIGAAARAVVATLSGHVAMAGFIWLTVSTPYDAWFGHPTTWLNDNPRVAGAVLLTLGGGALAGLFATRRRKPAEMGSPS